MKNQNQTFRTKEQKWKTCIISGFKHTARVCCSLLQPSWSTRALWEQVRWEQSCCHHRHMVSSETACGSEKQHSPRCHDPLRSEPPGSPTSTWTTQKLRGLTWLHLVVIRQFFNIQTHRYECLPAGWQNVCVSGSVHVGPSPRCRKTSCRVDTGSQKQGPHTYFLRRHQHMFM